MSCLQKILILVISLCISDRAYTQVDTIVWQNKDSLPSFPRTDIASFMIDSNYYIIGGDDESGAWNNEVWKYNIPNNSWRQMKNFPGGPITTETGFAFNGHGYICIGSDSITGYNNDNEFWEYYPAVDTWQHKANYPGVGRESGAPFMYANYAFVGMGWGVGANDLWRYDAISDTWDSVSNMPGGSRLGYGLAVVDSFAYVFGGFSPYYNYNDFWRYDMIHDHWDSIGIMPTGKFRSNSIFWTLGNFILGGYGMLLDTLGNFSLATDMYSYNTKTNKWDTLSCINFPDSIAAGIEQTFMLGETAYFFGGYKTWDPNYSMYPNVWSFDASRFFPSDTSTGITTVNSDVTFSFYPNPVSHEQGFSVSTSESGSISFCDALGRLLDERPLSRGLTQIRLVTDEEIVFYRATLSGGMIKNGKVVFIK